MDSDVYFSRRQLGGATVTVIDEGMGWYRQEFKDTDGNEVDAFGPDHPNGLPIGFHVAHIKTSSASVLIDAGFDDPDSEWGRQFSRAWFVKRTPGLAAALEAIGESRESITHVAITHAHFDHVAGLTIETDGAPAPRFPNARVYIHRAEVERLEAEANDPAGDDINQRLGVVKEHELLHPIEDGDEIAPGITMEHTGGESAGHCVVRVAAGGPYFMALGDLFHYGFEVEHLDWMAPWADAPAMLAARKRVVRQATERETVCMFSHHPFPPWGVIERSGSDHRWRQL